MSLLETQRWAQTSADHPEVQEYKEPTSPIGNMFNNEFMIRIKGRYLSALPSAVGGPISCLAPSLPLSASCHNLIS